MKTIIAGSRRVYDVALVAYAVEQSGFTITEVGCGEAKGIDTSGKHWAIQNQIPYKSFPADWDKYGNAAGPIRNQEMAEWGDALIAIPDAESKGTRDMINKARALGYAVYVFEIAEDDF